jgi:hypothetical protein
MEKEFEVATHISQFSVIKNAWRNKYRRVINRDFGVGVGLLCFIWKLCFFYLKREVIGLKIYGRFLQTFNGRNYRIKIKLFYANFSKYVVLTKNAVIHRKKQ